FIQGGEGCGSLLVPLQKIVTSPDIGKIPTPSGDRDDVQPREEGIRRERYLVIGILFKFRVLDRQVLIKLVAIELKVAGILEISGAADGIQRIKVKLFIAGDKPNGRDAKEWNIFLVHI